MNIQAVAKLFTNGVVTGSNSIKCRAPNHSNRDGSLSIIFGEQFPNGFIVHSFAGDDWKACRDYVKSVLGIINDYKSRETVRIAPLPTKGNTDKTKFAERIWNESTRYIDSPAWNYLVTRGLSPVNTSALKYHAACPFMGDKAPAMIVAMVNAQTNEFQGIHRTRLNPKDKAMLGSSKGAVVKLSNDESVTSSLNICEGIETGIALMNMGYAPVWSCLTAGGIAKCPVIEGIETLTIFADNDANQAGQNAAIECAIRWRDAGVEVKVFAPAIEGKDFADGGAS